LPGQPHPAGPIPPWGGGGVSKKTGRVRKKKEYEKGGLNHNRGGEAGTPPTVDVCGVVEREVVGKGGSQRQQSGKVGMGGLKKCVLPSEIKKRKEVRDGGKPLIREKKNPN